MASALEAANATLSATATETPEPDTERETEPVEAVVEPVKDNIVIETAAVEDAPVSEPEPTVDTVEDAPPSPAEAMLAELNAAEASPQQNPEIEEETETPEPAPRSNALSLEDPVVDAPSIGPKTASRLEQVDIYTIGDLLNADPAETASALSVRYIKADTLTDWQDQTRLMVDAPGLRVLDSQILVGAGIRSVDDLARASATKVLTAATTFLDTPQGARVLWGGDNNVDKTEVEHWIDLAKSAQG